MTSRKDNTSVVPAVADNVHPFATSFLEAAPYLVRARGEHFVLWLDEAIDDDAMPRLAEEIAILHVLGVRLTLFVGGGPAERGPVDATAEMAADGDSMRRLGRWQDLLSRGWTGISDRRYRLSVVSGNMIAARRVGVVGGVDQGHLGTLRSVDVEDVHAMHQGGHLLIFTGALSGATGLPLWVPPLSLAVDYAARLRVAKLILLTAAPVFAAAPAEISPDQLMSARSSAVGAAARLYDAAAQALDLGVSRVHAVPAKEHGALLAELFSRRGSGLLWTRSPTAAVTPVQGHELSELVALISRFQRGGALAERSRELIEAQLDDFRVLKVDGRLVACGALRRVGEGAALIESVAVHPDYQGEGRGAALLRALEHEAAGFAGTIYIYTTIAEEWFEGFGYTRTALDAAPAAVRAAFRPVRGSVLLSRPADDAARPAG